MKIIKQSYLLKLSGAEYSALKKFIGATSKSDRIAAGLSDEQDDLLSVIWNEMDKSRN